MCQCEEIHPPTLLRSFFCFSFYTRTSWGAPSANDWSHNYDKCTHMQRTYLCRLYKSLRGKYLAGLDKPTFKTLPSLCIVSLCYFSKLKQSAVKSEHIQKKTDQSGTKLAQVFSTGHWFFNRNFSLKVKIIELETTCWCACPEVSVLTHVYPYTQVQVRLVLHLSRCAAVCSRSSGTDRNVQLAEDIQWGLCTA